jgi:hypothetical protein
MIDVIFELTLVNDMVDFFADSIDTAFSIDLTDEELVVSRLAELKSLVDRFLAISNDIFKL